jgi:hypothetical protein
MRSAVKVALLCAAGLLAGAGGAGAAEMPASANPFEAFGGAVSATLGLGTPVGLLGIEGQLDLRSWLMLTAGGGKGNAGPQVAAMLHLRALLHAERSASAALTLGYGLSGGRYHEQLCIFDSCNPELGGTLWWHNIQGGVELLLPSASGRYSLVLRPFVGVAIAGNPRDLKCLDCTSLSYEVTSRWLPFAGISAGVGFH